MLKPHYKNVFLTPIFYYSRCHRAQYTNGKGQNLGVSGDLHIKN